MPGSERKNSRQRPWESSAGGADIEFGQWLRRQREMRDVTLRDIADTTKISIRYLEALEENRFDVLPAAVFVKGFLREYATFVGMDPDEVVNTYLNAQQQGVEAEQAEAEAAKSTGTVPWAPGLVLGLAGLLLLAAVAFLAFYFERSRDEPGGATTVAAADVAEAVSTSAPATERQPPANGASIGSQAASGSAPGAATTDSDSATPGPAGSRQPGADLEDRAETGPRSDAPLRVTLDFTEDCWVEALIDTSERISELRVQGESLQISAQSEVRLTLGNPAGVRVEVNGEPYVLDFREGRVARDLRIDLASLADREPPTR